MTIDDEGVMQIGWLGEPGRDGEHLPTLVLLHGYGSNENDLISAMPVVSAFLPDIRAEVLAVRGFFPIPGRPGGYSWFPGNAWEQPSAQRIAATADRIAGLVRERSESAVFLGFSQGMCAAITVLRRFPRLVRGLVALSGFSFDADQPGDQWLADEVRAGRGLPAFYGWDPADPAIPGYASAWALQFLRTHTALEEKTYPGMGHSLSMDEIGDVVNFLRPLIVSDVAGRGDAAGPTSKGRIA
jgi:phospholipase/carboxylesterase